MATSKLNAGFTYDSTSGGAVGPNTANRLVEARRVLTGGVDIIPSACGVSAVQSGLGFSAPSGSAAQTYALRLNASGAPADSLTLLASNSTGGGATDSLILRAVPVGAAPYAQYAVVVDLAAGGRAGQTAVGTGASQTVNVTGCSATSTVQLTPLNAAAIAAAYPTVTPAAGSFSFTNPASAQYNYVVWG